MEQTYKPYDYIAFISYKREDEKWAKWLQKKLESYRLPTALRKENPELPDKVRPVFRDQSDLSGAKLKEEIEKGLNESKYLIVICSPRSANSPWVSREVQHFIDQGREEHIIPFIIGGTPNAINPEDECFPDGLRKLKGEQELLGININEMGRDAAVVKVVARMFNLKFDRLWQRFEKERKKRLTIIGASALCLILATLIVAGFIVKQNFRLEAAYTEIKQERDRANNETKRANKEKLRAETMNNALRIANDSITLSTHLLDVSNKKLCSTNTELEKANRTLKEERDHIKSINNELLKTNSNLILSSAYDLLTKGQAIDAGVLVSQIHPRYNSEYPELSKFEDFFRELNDSLEYGLNGPFVLSKHNAQFMCSEFSNDGEILVSGSNDYTARVWSMSTGKEFQNLRMQHKSTVDEIAVSPNKNFVLTHTLNEDSIYLWDIQHNSRIINRFGYGQSPQFINNSKILYRSGKHNENDLFAQEGITIYDCIQNKFSAFKNMDFLIYREDLDISIGVTHDKTENKDDIQYEIHIINQDNEDTLSLAKGSRIENIEISRDGKLLFIHYVTDSNAIMYLKEHIDIYDLVTNSIFPASLQLPTNRLLDYVYITHNQNRYLAYVSMNVSEKQIKFWDIDNDSIHTSIPFKDDLKTIRVNPANNNLFVGSYDGYGYFYNPFSIADKYEADIVAKETNDFVPSRLNHGAYYKLISEADSIVLFDKHHSAIAAYNIPVCVASIFEYDKYAFITTYDFTSSYTDAEYGDFVTFLFTDHIQQEVLPYPIQGIAENHPWIARNKDIYDFEKDKVLYESQSNKWFNTFGIFYNNDNNFITKNGTALQFWELKNSDNPLRTIELGYTIDNILYSKAGNRLYVEDSRDNVTIINLSDYSVVHTLKLYNPFQNDVSTLYYDDNSDRLYYRIRINSYWDKEPIYQYRYKYIPKYDTLLNNTFKILPIVNN